MFKDLVLHIQFNKKMSFDFLGKINSKINFFLSIFKLT